MRPPRDGIELALSGIFEELLDIAPPGIDEAFFDLGGHSLLAVRLVARIKRVFGAAIPVSVLFEDLPDATPSSTIEHLGRLVRADARADAGAGAGTVERDRPVVLQRHGCGPPLFCVHPAGGEVLAFRDLAAALGAERPVYGLQATAVENGECDVVRLASRHLERIKAIQPRGPYSVLGWSMGGAVAFEICAQLGADVALLALLDSYPGEHFAAPQDAALERAFAYDMARILGLPTVSGPAAGITLTGLIEEGATPPETDVSHLMERFAVYRSHVQALRRYRPSRQVDELTLIFAGDGDPAAQAAAAASWQRAVRKPITRHTVGGDHYSMLAPPRVDTLAHLLKV
jgi:thioesterase domain-containing protein